LNVFAIKQCAALEKAVTLRFRPQAYYPNATCLYFGLHRGIRPRLILHCSGVREHPDFWQTTERGKEADVAVRVRPLVVEVQIAQARIRGVVPIATS
jgi:hypothetical protein